MIHFSVCHLQTHPMKHSLVFLHKFPSTDVQCWNIGKKFVVKVEKSIQNTFYTYPANVVATGGPFFFPGMIRIWQIVAFRYSTSWNSQKCRLTCQEV
jgi:hypothetical protein